ncbi:MAG: Holliday junction resolvase RuvX [Candidatus Hydrogenedentes bacterium]|nr:Holliday junction resolvase RuvX [Candidatus Hydrogenedentota bacterium]
MNSSGRIMALDVGDVRTGVAVTDPLQMIASPHSVVREKSLAAAVDAVARLTAELEVVLIVAGIPLNREGQRGPQAEKVLRFLELLRAKVEVEIVTQDERFSTAEAERMLIGADVRRGKRKQVVDKIAATHILQTFLERRQRENRDKKD